MASKNVKPNTCARVSPGRRGSYFSLEGERFPGYGVVARDKIALAQAQLRFGWETIEAGGSWPSVLILVDCR